MTKITGLLYGMIFVGFIIGVFGLYMADMNKNYGVAYDNTSLEEYNNLNEMSELAEELEGGTEIEEKTGVVDVIGGYFTDAYNALKITKKSYNTFDGMSNQAIEDANLGKTGQLLRIAISAIVLIAIVVGVILSAIIKKDL